MLNNQITVAKFNKIPTFVVLTYVLSYLPNLRHQQVFSKDFAAQEYEVCF